MSFLAAGYARGLAAEAGRLVQGQPHYHGRAFSLSRLQVQSAVVVGDDAAHDRQPDACAPYRLLNRVRCPEELLEQVLLVHLGDADAGIADGHLCRRLPERRRRGNCCCTYPYLPAAGRELDRVGQQVTQGPVELVGIAY